MKKLLLSLVALMAISMTANAQYVKLYKGEKLVGQYSKDQVDKVEFSKTPVTTGTAKAKLDGTDEVDVTGCSSGRMVRSGPPSTWAWLPPPPLEPTFTAASTLGAAALHKLLAPSQTTATPAAPPSPAPTIPLPSFGATTGVCRLRPSFKVL